MVAHSHAQNISVMRPHVVKAAEKPTSVQDNWIIGSGLFKNKDQNTHNSVVFTF